MSACLPLSTFTFQEQSFHAASSGEFSRIMIQLSLASKLIARDIRKAGLNQLLGTTGSINVQGEEVKKLDERANQIFLEVFENQELVSTLVSEEMEKPFFVKNADGRGKYAVFLDPLDGSSNTDVNAPLGSIFSIYRLSGEGGAATEETLRKKGSEQVAAGYFLYGPGVVLVYTCGSGVYQFTLDPGGGEFFLTAKSLKIPSKGSIYSANEGNRMKWLPGVRKFLDHLQEWDPPSGRPYSGRYSGCLVADVHRVLLKGGLYFYPGETKKPEGKLRLMYEAAPLSFLVEQAGGKGSTGWQRVNDLVPRSLHQRIPFWIGSRDDVALAETYHQTESQT